MFPTWRLKLREARVAWQSGRYDEAGALLAEDSLREFLPAKRLAQDVAGKLVERAGRSFAQGDSAAGWRDLATADRLGGQTEAISRLRREHADCTLAEIRRYLAADQASAALSRLENLRRKGLADEASRALQQIATLVHQADEAATRGHFPEALEAVRRAQELAAEDAAEHGTMEIAQRLSQRSDEIARQGAECQRLSTELHDAIGRNEWGAVLSTAEALLAVAPQHTAAREARRRAWKAVGMNVTRDCRLRPVAGHVSLRLEQAIGNGGHPSTRRSPGSQEDDTVTGKQRPRRALLWIDAVGGFLVCLDDEVVLGQPSPAGGVGLPILADLSRRHAVIRREQGCYVLEPVHEVSVDGRKVTGPVLLADGQLIQLGESVRLRFTRPHALSATARLVLESHHKTVPSADAVLLMADSCVLGPSRHCHVQCRDWQHDVVIYRQNDRLSCRSTGPLTVDGQSCGGPTEIEPGAQVQGEEFSFTWETVE
jgi:hypothetical protein